MELLMAVLMTAPSISMLLCAISVVVPVMLALVLEVERRWRWVELELIVKTGSIPFAIEPLDSELDGQSFFFNQSRLRARWDDSDMMCTCLVMEVSNVKQLLVRVATISSTATSKVASPD
jgi:hypothetical protein